MKPFVSVIVPAYNAAATLTDTLDSLARQTFRDWEAVVVDDGSTDATAGLAESFAAREPRVRLVRQEQAGEGGARNGGVRVARGDWLLFLDADDWVAPAALERWAGAVSRDPELDAVTCGWVFVDLQGQVFGTHLCEQTGDLFPYLAEQPLFPVHACLVRREIFDRIGGFDVALRTCADWDFWQRVARTGARFGAVREPLSWYRMRPNATWTGSRQYVRDGLRLVEQGHRADPRVHDPLPRHAQGRPRENLPGARLRFLCRPAAMELARGGEALDILDAVPRDAAPDLDPIEIARTIFYAAPLPSCSEPQLWASLWNTVENRLVAFLTALESQAAASGLARRARTELERLVLAHAATQRPRTVGTTHAERVELTEPLSDISMPGHVERLLCHLTLEGVSIGDLQLPVFDGVVPSSVLADAVVADHAWKILGCFFERTLYPQLVRHEGAQGATLARGGSALEGTIAHDSRPFWERAHDRVGWEVFVQELWGLDWQRAQIYGVEPRNETRTPIERRVKEWTIVEASAEMPCLAVAGDSVSVIFTIGGATLGSVRVSAQDGTISAQTLRAWLSCAGGLEMCRVAVREAILGRPLGAEPAALRKRLAAAAAYAAARATGPARARKSSRRAELLYGWPVAGMGRAPGVQPSIVVARRPGVIGTSVSRRAALPATAIDVLAESVAASAELLFRARRSRPARAAYLPDVVWRDVHASRWIERVAPNSRVPQAQAQPSGDVAPAAAGSATPQLPILMYHRIADDGAPATARYRLAPARFEEQLRMLRDADYRSVSLEAWRSAREARQPVPGRAVVLTFDDGCRDFATHAWPLLRSYGFTAIVFLVADRIGATASWDAARGEEVALLGWEEIHALAAEGVIFGSHSAAHRRMSGLSPVDIVRESARSRAVLERGLGCLVDSIAYPHGAEDAIVRHLAGACGYVFGLSCQPGLAVYDDPLLALPRIEVRGDWAAAELRAALAHDDESPRGVTP